MSLMCKFVVKLCLLVWDDSSHNNTACVDLMVARSTAVRAV